MIDINQFPDVDVFQQRLDRGRGMLTILRGGWNVSNPKAYMDEAVRQFVDNKLYNQFIEIHLDIPQVRVIIEDINEITYTGIRDFYQAI